MKKKASVIICTRNRKDYTSRCLDSLVRQDFDSTGFEVLLVDNGSSDGTKEAVMGFTSRLDLQYIWEPIPGLSRARNRALEKVGADISIFLDDDAEAYPDWLNEILQPFETHGDEVGIVAGEVDPVWETARPEWLDDKYINFYSAGINWDTEPRFLRADEWALECNMAVRTRALRGKGGFNETLGRVGDSLVSCEGIVFEELRNEGIKAFYNPHARVRHTIHSDRLNKTWLLRRSFSQGVSTAILSEFFPKTRDVPDVGINVKKIHELEIEDIPPEHLFQMVVYFDRLGFVLKKKKLI